MNLEEARSEADSYSDAESSASSTRRKSAGFSDLSSIRKSRRADKSTSAIRNHHTLHGARRRDIVKRQAGSSTEADESINYVAKVKKTFGDKPGTYLAFLEILHTYQKEQKSIKDVYEEVSCLFKDHTELLAEFSSFLPQSTKKAPIEFDQATNYVDKIKKTFEDKPGTYHAFLGILSTYHQGQKSILDVKGAYEEASRLFTDHPGLLAEFSLYLPDGSTKASLDSTADDDPDDTALGQCFKNFTLFSDDQDELQLKFALELQLQLVKRRAGGRPRTSAQHLVVQAPRTSREQALNLGVSRLHGVSIGKKP